MKSLQTCLEVEILVKAIGIAGFKKSGKTRIVEKLLKGLKDKGNRVGTIKHVPKEDFTIDQRGTDSWRHAQAGSEKIVLISPGELATLEKRSADLEEILHKVEELDYVIVEGFRDSEIVPKIMVARDEEEAEKLNDDFTVGFIENGTKNKPVIKKQEEIEKLIDLVEEKAMPPLGGLNCGECGYESCKDFALAVFEGEAPKDGCVAFRGPVSLKVDGKRVPLKPFVEGLIARTVSGMVSSLKETEGEKIELEVDKFEG